MYMRSNIFIFKAFIYLPNTKAPPESSTILHEHGSLSIFRDISTQMSNGQDICDNHVGTLLTVL